MLNNSVSKLTNLYLFNQNVENLYIQILPSNSPLPHSIGPGTFALISHTYNPLFEKILDPPLIHGNLPPLVFFYLLNPLHSPISITLVSVDPPSYTFIYLHNPSFTFIHLHLLPLAFIHAYLPPLAFFYLHPPTSPTISLYPRSSTPISLHSPSSTSISLQPRSSTPISLLLPSESPSFTYFHCVSQR